MCTYHNVYLGIRIKITIRSMHYKTCEICGIKSGRVGGQKRTFMAKFPLDEVRCKKWVQVTGKEDLAYVPIEKLHSLKYICGKHFQPRDFKKKKTQLKKNAVPSLLITSKPLPSEILVGFPLHSIESSTSTAITTTVGTDDSKTKTPCSPNLRLEPYDIEFEHNYNRRYSETPSILKNDDRLSSSNILLKSSRKDIEGISIDGEHFEEEYLEEIIEDDFQQLPEEADRADISSGEFSWQRASAVVPCDADDVADAECSADAVMFEAAPQRVHAGQDEPVHEGYRCNCCSGSIVGFRYVCVQCADYDLCGACEAGGVHMEHYVLRVPGPRPYSEVAGVLHTIRRALVADSILLVDGMQVEVKEEPGLSDPMSMEMEATDGEDRETDGNELAGVDMPLPRSLENDDNESSEDDSTCGDSDTDLNQLKESGNTNKIVSAVSNVAHTKVDFQSFSTRQNIKGIKSDSIYYFDRTKNTIVYVHTPGDDNNGGMKPSTLKCLPHYKILTDKRSTPIEQALLDSKRARVTLDRLSEAELHTALQSNNRRD